MSEQLDRLERLLAEVTPGPWRIDHDGCCVYDAVKPLAQVAIGAEGTPADALAIVWLRNNADALLAIARAAEEWEAIGKEPVTGWTTGDFTFDIAQVIRDAGDRYKRAGAALGAALARLHEPQP